MSKQELIKLMYEKVSRVYRTGNLAVNGVKLTPCEVGVLRQSLANLYNEGIAHLNSEAVKDVFAKERQTVISKRWYGWDVEVK